MKSPDSFSEPNSNAGAHSKPVDRELELVAAIEAADQLPAEEREAFLLARFEQDASAQSLILEWMREEGEPGKFTQAWEVLEPIVQTPSVMAATSETPANIDATTDFSTGSGGSGSATSGRPMELPLIPDHQLGEVLGSGGMGMVVEAFDEQLQINVAIKLMRGGLLETESARQRFLSEARAVAKLRHPGIVGVMQQGETDDGVLWFSMERVRGQPLNEMVPEGGMPVREAARITRQVAEALAVAHHADIYHRDIKPANVLLDNEGQPRVVDFGLAKDMSTDLSHTHDGRAIGTPYYMAPEQINRDVGPISAATDIYGLGGLLYYLLVKRPPHREKTQVAQLNAVLNDDAKSPIEHRAGVPRDLAAICLKCLEKNPANRYASASDLADDLSRFEQGLPVTARTLSRPQRVQRWAKRNPLAVTILAVSLIGVLVSTYFARRAVQGESLAEIRAEDLEEQKAVVTEKADELAAVNENMQQQLYGADVRDAFQSLRDDDYQGAFTKAIRLIPEPGQVDRRGIEWRLLWHRLSGPYRMLHCPGSYFGHSKAHFSIGSDNRSLAYSAGDKTHVWDYVEGKLIAQYEATTAPRYLADGKSVVCVQNGEVAICDSTTFVPRLSKFIEGEIRDLFSSADGQQFGVVIRIESLDHVELFDTRTFNCIYAGEHHGTNLRKATFSPDGRLIAVAHSDRIVRVTDLRTGEIQTLQNGYQPIGVDFSSDGRYLVACPLGYAARVWETENWTMVARLVGNDKAWRMAKFTSDDKHLIMSGYDGRIWQYRTDDWELLSQRNVDLAVWWGDISPDGNTLILGGRSGKRTSMEGYADGGTGLRVFHLDRDFEPGLRWHDWGQHYDPFKVDADYSFASASADMSRVSRFSKARKELELVTPITADKFKREVFPIAKEAIEIQSFGGGKYTGYLDSSGKASYVSWTNYPKEIDIGVVDVKVMYRDFTYPETLWLLKNQSISRFVPGNDMATMPINDVPDPIAMDRSGNQTFIANEKTVVAFDESINEVWRHELTEGQILSMTAIDGQSVMISTDRRNILVVDSEGLHQWATLPQSARTIRVGDHQRRIFIQYDEREIDLWDMATRRSLTQFRTTKNKTFDADPLGKWLLVASSRTRGFKAPTDQDVFDELLRMAETENANAMVLSGLDRQLRWMGLDESTINDATRVAMRKARQRNKQLTGEDDAITWTVLPTKSRQLKSAVEQGALVKEKIVAGFRELQEKSSGMQLESFWAQQRLASDGSQLNRKELHESFDSLVKQLKPAVKQSISNLRERIAWLDERTLLVFKHKKIRCLDLLTGEQAEVAAVPNYIWCALSDPQRGCVYIGTGGTWKQDVKRVVSDSPAKLLRFDTSTWQSQTLYEYSEGKITNLVFVDDGNSLVMSGQGTTGRRIDLDTGEVTQLNEVIDGSSIGKFPESNQVVAVCYFNQETRLVDTTGDRLVRSHKFSGSGIVDFVHSFDDGKLLGYVAPDQHVSLVNFETGQVVARHEMEIEYETYSTANDDYLLAGIHKGRLFQLFADPNVQPRVFQIGGNRCLGIAMLSGHEETVILSTDQGISLMRLPSVSPNEEND